MQCNESWFSHPSRNLFMLPLRFSANGGLFGFRVAFHNYGVPWMIVILFSLLALISGCADDEGEPWGVAEFDVTTSFLPDSDSRIDDQGRLITSSNYLLDVDSLTLRVNSASVDSAAEAAADFDPANPPAGYSLCHNGHCHADDGSLVDYEDIAAELSQSSGSSSVVHAIDTTVEINQQSTQVPLNECSNQCQLEQGHVVAVSLATAELVLSGRIYQDLSDSDWPTDGVATNVTIELSSTFTQALSLEVDRGKQQRIELNLLLEVSQTLFDGVDFADESLLGSSGSQRWNEERREYLSQLVQVNFNDSLFQVNVNRTDF